jgi:nitrate/nitrite transport system substrate-binding protein
MPLAISMGLGANATPMNVATIQNVNGQGLSRWRSKHKNNRDQELERLQVCDSVRVQHAQLLLQAQSGRSWPEPDTDVHCAWCRQPR